MNENVFPNIDTEEIERQYFLRALRPDYDTVVIPDWLKRSERFLQNHQGTLDLAYGNAERNHLDFFPAPIENNNGDFVLYIHGGYWQRGDKSVYSFLAEGFLERGISVALINYPMCPNIAFSKIANHVQQAVKWLWEQADDLGFNRDKLNVMGHSAGAHLTVEMLQSDWTSIGLPANIIRSGIALSGLYDLEPLLQCSENERLKLDMDEVNSASPMKQNPDSLAPLLLGYGMNEPPDMHRQSIQYFDTFKDKSSRMECLAIPDADHFDVVNVLGDENSDLFEQTLSFIV